jgi:hypothetical protein
VRGEHFSHARHLLVNLLLGDGLLLDLDGDALVLWQLELRRHVNRDGEGRAGRGREEHGADVHDVNRGDFFLFERLAVELADEGAFDLLVNVRAVVAFDDGAWRLSRAETGRVALPDEHGDDFVVRRARFVGRDGDDEFLAAGGDGLYVNGHNFFLLKEV